MRAKGVGWEFADLLEEAGVDSCTELAARNPDNLRSVLVQLNEQQQLVQHAPSLAMVRRWVAGAKRFPKVVRH
jgi:hypothetical protein